MVAVIHSFAGVILEGIGLGCRIVRVGGVMILRAKLVYRKDGVEMETGIDCEFVPRVGEKIELAGMEGYHLEVTGVTHTFTDHQDIRIDAKYVRHQKASDFFI